MSDIVFAEIIVRYSQTFLWLQPYDEGQNMRAGEAA